MVKRYTSVIAQPLKNWTKQFPMPLKPARSHKKKRTLLGSNKSKPPVEQTLRCSIGGSFVSGLNVVRSISLKK